MPDVLSECAAARHRMHYATTATTTQAASCSAMMNYQHSDGTTPLVYSQLFSLEGTPAVYALFHSEAEYLYQATRLLAILYLIDTKQRAALL